MNLDPQLAAELGFPKPEYFSVERERRWLCREVPREHAMQTEQITDLYVTGARLRLREARPLNGGAARLRLTRKADVDAYTRLITSIYLSEGEFSILATALVGIRIRKLRHRLEPAPGVKLAIDEFQNDLSGLVLAEAEFETNEQLAAFPMPHFALREVTHDPKYSGIYLATEGPPKS